MKDIRGLRFLIVDDKGFIRNLVNSMLLRHGARQIMQAANGEEALKLLHKNGGRCDCIISDWNMHPVNGLQLLQMVRAGKAHHTPPSTCFILLTGAADAAVVNTAVELDVTGYLVKPVSFDKLVRTLDAALAREVAIKRTKHYEAVPVGDVPPALREVRERSPAAVVWQFRALRGRQPRESMDTLSDSGVEMQGGAAARREFKSKERRALAEIPAGAILAGDVYGPEGQLLIGVGTILSASVLGRLRDLAEESGEDVRLWIGEYEGSSS